MEKGLTKPIIEEGGEEVSFGINELLPKERPEQKEISLTEEEIKQVEMKSDEIFGNQFKEEDYLTIEKLKERKELIKQKEKDIEEAKIQRDDTLSMEEMKKLDKLLGKEPSISPTIAKEMPTNDNIPAERTSIFGEIVLENKSKLIKDKFCPVCNGKLKTQVRVIKSNDGLYEIQNTRCVNSIKKFGKKITCDYEENRAERID